MATSPNDAKSNSGCAQTEHSDLPPCIIVIFGASGDLAARKLIPSLFQMYVKKSLPQQVAIVGCARTAFSRDQFIDHLRPACCSAQEQATHWQDFSKLLHYQQIQYDNRGSFAALATLLADLDQGMNTGGNLIFDLAVPPHLYPQIAQQLGESGLARQNQENKGWARIVVEKPFGRNLTTALELDQLLHRYFEEDQIFRIDHYLAKETVQNILMFRFANHIFEPIWSRGYIDWVAIISAEKLGVENRAGYYDQSGVIRDMFQNHMMQLLALVAMEPPSHFEAGPIRDEKVKVFRSIRPFTGDEADIILGQYQKGKIDSKAVAGYPDEPGVAENSRTPTFAQLRFFIDNWRWQGVPFHLISGKRLQEKVTRIVIQFKEVPHSLFRDVLGEEILGNRLVLSVYPEESIHLTFQTKNPGARICLRSMSLDFHYQDHYHGPSLDAYEKVLLDCILGDHMLFWRQDGVEQTWSLLTPILEDCEGDHCRIHALHPYPAGSWGPEASQEIVREILQ
ncbi:MAG: glucose-6-phosphate dehydrogenase [Thermodesulfobacteriota bacterium]